MGRARPAIGLVLVLALVAGAAAAAEWDTVDPGRSTMETVRAHYGGPTRTTIQKVEGYDTVQWVYEGGQAPAGITRVVIDFGLLTSAGFRPELVRAVKLEPKPGIFSRDTIVTGWGEPTSISAAGQPKAFFYQSGLVVLFDDEGQEAQSLLFTPPQPTPPGGGAPRP